MKQLHSSKASNPIVWLLLALSLVSMKISCFTFNVEKAAAQSQQARREVSDYEIKLQSRSFTPPADVPEDLAVRIRRMIAKTDSLTKLKKQRVHK